MFNEGYDFGLIASANVALQLLGEPRADNSDFVKGFNRAIYDYWNYVENGQGSDLFPELNKTL